MNGPTAISLKEIPEKYKSFRRIGNGASSIVLGYDKNYVLMFTRDKFKYDYFVKNGIGEHLETYYSNIQNDKLSKYPIHVFLVERLYPLTPSNERYVYRVIISLRDVLHNFSLKNTLKNKLLRPRINAFVSDMIKKSRLEFADFSSLQKICDYIIEHELNHKDLRIDLHMGNFLENKKGEIVFFDPFYDVELLKLVKSLDKNNELKEVRLDEVPDRFRKNYSFLNKGVESIVLNYDSKFVLLFTEDKGKINWIVESGLGKVVGSYLHPAHDDNSYIHVLLVKRLHALSRETDNKIEHMWAEFFKKVGPVPTYNKDTDDFKIASRSKPITNFSKKYEKLVMLLLKKYELHDRFNKDNLQKFMKFFIERGSGNAMSLDLHGGNFLEDDDGKLIFIDPIQGMRYKYFDDIVIQDIDKTFNESKRKPKKLSRKLYEEKLTEAITKMDLPKIFQKYKKLGSGFESIVLDYTENTVLSFIPETNIAKVTWFIESGLGRLIAEFNSPTGAYYMADNNTASRKNRRIFVLEVQKLYEIPRKKEEQLYEIMTFIQTHLEGSEPSGDNLELPKESKTRNKRYIDITKGKHSVLLRKFFKKYKLEFFSEDHYAKFLEFVYKYGGVFGNGVGYEKGIMLDLTTQNLMMTKDGKIVLSDPIVTVNKDRFPDITAPDINTIELKNQNRNVNETS